MIAIGIMGISFLMGMFNRKSKMVAVIISLYMWVFYSFNTYSGDSAAYEYVYQLISEGYVFGHFEIGFTILMLMCSKIGLSFSGFRFVLGTIYIVALNKVIKKYTDNIAIVLALFMIFPFMYFTSVLRAGIAGLIVVNSVQHLSVKGKKGIFMYAIGILFAMLFHTSSMFFFVLVLARKKISQRTVIKIIVVTTIVSFLFRNAVFYKVFSIFTQNAKILQWLNGDGTASSALNITGIVAEISLLIMILFIVSRANKLERQCGVEGKRMKQCELIKSCNFYLLTLIPFMIISDVWMRMVWEFLLIDICMFANVIEDLHEKSFLNRNKFAISYFGLVVIMLEIIIFLYMDRPYWGTDNMAVNMFYNNRLLGMLPF